KGLFPEDKAMMLSARNLEIIEDIAERTMAIKSKCDEMVEQRKKANRIENIRDKAIAYHDNVAPMIEEIRHEIDELELIVDDGMWTLPKYRELLFVR
ncbi:MAG: glutamine synthetase type III, partial [Tidjanibacter sp.]|nr:glutamine synthetase type III [Tidjanibacter sp.]